MRFQAHPTQHIVNIQTWLITVKTYQTIKLFYQKDFLEFLQNQQFRVFIKIYKVNTCSMLLFI